MPSPMKASVEIPRRHARANSSSSCSDSDSSSSDASAHPLHEALMTRRRPPRASSRVAALREQTSSSDRRLKSFLDEDEEHEASGDVVTLRSAQYGSAVRGAQVVPWRNARQSVPTSSPTTQQSDAPMPHPVRKEVVRLEFGDEYVGDVIAVAATPDVVSQLSLHHTASSVMIRKRSATVVPSSNIDTSSSTNSPATNSTSETTVLVPHGVGTLQSSTGRHSYIGSFENRERHGQGKLLTDQFVLWCQWVCNRPDFAVSARFDTASGDKYFGYLTARTDSDKFQKLSKQTAPGSASSSSSSQQTPLMSKFSMWVNSTHFTKERWGEVCRTDGSRYFGQWDNDHQKGFGCALSPNGDRYVGMFQDDTYHGMGVLFSVSGQIDRLVSHASPPQHKAHKHSSTDSRERGGSMASSTQQGGSSSCMDHHRSVQSLLWQGGWYTTGASLQRSPVLVDLMVPARAVTSQYPVVLDGEWRRGAFTAEADDKTVVRGRWCFPCGTNISALWSDATSARDGRIETARRPRVLLASHSVVGDAHSSNPQRRWLITSMWEPLLCGSADASKRRSIQAAKCFRDRIRRSGSRDVIAAQLKRLLKEDAMTMNAVKIFRRCFYFFFGTCGSSREVGGGLAGNPLGWCQFRASFGGCIHRGRGRPIGEADIESALTDVFSLVTSVTRWAHELLGDEAMERVVEADAEAALGRIAIDLILGEVFPLLLNLYSQVYRDEEDKLQLALIRMKDRISLDDLGVAFGRHASDRLFDPYADACRSLSDLGRCRTLSEMVQTLVKWSHEIDTATRLAQVNLHEDQIAMVSSTLRGKQRHPPPPLPSEAVTLAPVAAMISTSEDDAGAEIHQHKADGPRTPDEPPFAALGNAFDGATEAYEEDEELEVQVIEGKTDKHILGEPNDVVLNASFITPSSSPALRPVEAARQEMPSPRVLPHTNSPQEALHHHQDPSAYAPDRRSTASAARLMRLSGKQFLTSASQPGASIESGSADDLIPIHQYVLARAGHLVPTLYAVTRLLMDLSSDETVVDGTSQDAFCITTLQACVSTLTELDLRIRSASQPVKSVAKHANSTAMQMQQDTPCGVLTPMSVFLKRVEEVSAACHLASDPVVTRLLRSWLPQVVEAVADAGPLGESGVTIWDLLDARLGEASVANLATQIEGLLQASRSSHPHCSSTGVANEMEGLVSGMLVAADRLLKTCGLELMACGEERLMEGGAGSVATRFMKEHAVRSVFLTGASDFTGEMPPLPSCRLLHAVAVKLMEHLL